MLSCLGQPEWSCSNATNGTCAWCPTLDRCQLVDLEFECEVQVPFGTARATLGWVYPCPAPSTHINESSMNTMIRNQSITGKDAQAEKEKQCAAIPSTARCR
jgi:hypothetical protein